MKTSSQTSSQKMSKRAESCSLPRQLQYLRRVFEAWPTTPPTGADIAFAYITLCAAIEFTVGFHIRIELDKLYALIESTNIKEYFKCLNRIDENGQGQPYDESIGKGIFLRIIQQEQLRAERLTFRDLTGALFLLRDTKMPEVCKEVDDCLWGDLQGLSALRNSYAHGRPLRIDEDDDSRHNIDARDFSLREVVKSLRRMKIITGESNFFDQAGRVYDVLGSTMCITFYWTRTGEFISHYVASLPYDAAYYPRMVEVLEAVKPLAINGVDCL